MCRPAETPDDRDNAPDCVFFVESQGKFDLEPLEAATTPAK
jgi:hypothetical protein